MVYFSMLFDKVPALIKMAKQNKRSMVSCMKVQILIQQQIFINKQKLIISILSIFKLTVQMIVVQSIRKIDAILNSMRANNSRIYASFRLQTAKVIKLQTKLIYQMPQDTQKSDKSTRDSTFAQSKESEQNEKQSVVKIQNQSHRQQNYIYLHEGMDNLNQILQDSQEQNLSFQQMENPLKNFISPNNWNVTNSRNQKKSINFDIQIEPQCASFQHAEQQDGYDE